MAKLIRILGLPDGEIDAQKQDIAFTLSLKNQPAHRFVAQLGVAEQVAAALAHFAKTLRATIATATPVLATPVSQYQAQTDPLSERVLLVLVTPEGIRHTFAIPPDAAECIADRLRSESGRARQAPPGSSKIQ